MGLAGLVSVSPVVLLCLEPREVPEGFQWEWGL